jgi:starvation-inducible outer membrane lipoprotein
VQSWVNGKEDGEFVGVGARFGPKIVSKEKHANRTKLTLADPMDCCSPPKHKVAFFIQPQLQVISVCLPTA